MVNSCHVVSLTPAHPSGNRRDSRASGRCVSLRIPGRESDPISMGAQALSNVGLSLFAGDP